MEQIEKKMIIENAKKMIRSFVDRFCNENDSFYVCKLKETKEGYKSIEDFVLRRMSKGDTISQAINLKERLLDPNRIVD